MTTNNINKDMELNNILAEVEAKDFFGSEAPVAIRTKKNSVKIDKNSNIKKKPVEKVFTNNSMDKKTVLEIAKTVALMGATGICAYLKLVNPIVWIPIEIISLCAVSYKFGEHKGKNSGRTE